MYDLQKKKCKIKELLFQKVTRFGNNNKNNHSIPTEEAYVFNNWEAFSLYLHNSQWPCGRIAFTNFLITLLFKVNLIYNRFQLGDLGGNTVSSCA